MEEKKETMTASQPEQQATPTDKKEKRTFSRKKRVIVYLAVIVVILLLTNPAVIPFIPASVSAPVQEFMYKIFGSEKKISRQNHLLISTLLTRPYYSQA